MNIKKLLCFLFFFFKNSPCCEKAYHTTADWLYQVLKTGYSGLNGSGFSFCSRNIRAPLSIFFLRETRSKEEGESSEWLHLRLVLLAGVIGTSYLIAAIWSGKHTRCSPARASSSNRRADFQIIKSTRETLTKQ